LPAVAVVEQQRLAATVLVDAEQVRAGGQQLRAQSEEVREDVEDVGHVQPHGARQHRRKFFLLPVPEQVVDDDVVARTGRRDMDDRLAVPLQPDQHAFRVEAAIAAARGDETVSGHDLFSLSLWLRQPP